jgi:serine/threonine-protein kinase
MPPEQALGNWESVDARSDIWAVGAMLFTLLTGRLVHVADTINKLLLAAMTKPAPAIRSVRPDLPKPAAAIIDRALAFESKERWQDARSMQQAVREAQQSLRLATSLPAPILGDDGAAPDRPHLASASLLASSVSKTGIYRPKRTRPAILVGALAAAAIAGAIALVATRDEAPLRVNPTSVSAAQPGPTLSPVPPPAATTAAVVAPSLPTAPTATVEATPNTPEASPSSSARRDPGKKPPEKAGPKGTSAATTPGPKPAGSGDVFGSWN